MVQSFILKLFGMESWPREVQILKNTLDDETPPPGELPGQPEPAAPQPAPGFVSQVEPNTPVAH
jgi:hypothetical protein